MMKVQPQVLKVIAALEEWGQGRQLTSIGVEQVRWNGPSYELGLVDSTVLTVVHAYGRDEVVVPALAELIHVARGVYEYGLSRGIAHPFNNQVLAGIVELPDLLPLLIEQTNES